MSRILYHEKDDHDRFVEGMPPPPVLVLEDLPWRNRYPKTRKRIVG